MHLPAHQPLTSAVLVLLTFLVFLLGESVVWLWSLAGNVPLSVQVGAHVLAFIALLNALALGLDHTLQALWQIRQRWRATFGRSK